MASFRMKGSDKRTTMMSVRGRICGGKYDGWAYCFVRFLFDDKGNLLIELLGVDPDWPFPRTLQLPKSGFNSLDSVSGGRAERVDTTPLIEQAFTAHCEALTTKRGGPSPLGAKIAGLRRATAARLEESS
jgi:hypothetical protein